MRIDRLLPVRNAAVRGIERNIRVPTINADDFRWRERVAVRGVCARARLFAVCACTAPRLPVRSSRGAASNRAPIVLDATDLTALTFDPLPSTFSPSLPFHGRSRVRSRDMATSRGPEPENGGNRHGTQRVIARS